MKAVIGHAALIFFAWMAMPLVHTDVVAARDLSPGLQIPAAVRPGPNLCDRVHAAMFWLTENQPNPLANTSLPPPIQP